MSSTEETQAGTPRSPVQPAAAPTPSAEPEEKKAEATEYLVLSMSNSLWTEQKTIRARSAKEAIRSFLGGSPSPDGTYVAVPARSWQPVTVKTETETKLTLT